MESFNENDGVWRTIRGRRVFIRKGESLDSAMKRSGKFDNKTEGKRLAENTRQAKMEYEHAKDKYEHYKFADNENESKQASRKAYEEAKDKYRKADSEESEYLARKSGEAREKEIQSKYNEYYKKENLGEPSNYKQGDRVQVQDDYSGKYNSEYEVVREATLSEKQGIMNSNLKGYVLKDKNGNEITKADTRLKKIESNNGVKSQSNQVPEKMLKNANELSEIAKRTGKSDLMSEAGKKWDKLYKEDKSNIAYDLGDNYRAKLGYSGNIEISSTHPYNDTQYSWARANMENGKIKDWKVTIPGNGSETVKDVNSALKTMKTADNWIDTGKKVKDFEGVTHTHTPKTTYNEYKTTASEKSVNASKRIDDIAGNNENLQRLGRQMGSNELDRWNKAFNKYKLEHPETKLDLYKFIKMNKI